jgi:hypothetical protein
MARRRSVPQIELDESFLPGAKFVLTEARRALIREAINAFLALERHEQSVYLKTLSKLPGNAVHAEGKPLSDLREQVQDLKKQLAKHRRPRTNAARDARFLESLRRGLTCGQIARKEGMKRKTVEKACREELERLSSIDWGGIRRSLQAFLDLASHTEGDLWRPKQR